jgi:hypothetical protein
MSGYELSLAVASVADNLETMVACLLQSESQMLLKLIRSLLLNALGRGVTSRGLLNVSLSFVARGITL